MKINSFILVSLPETVSILEHGYFLQNTPMQGGGHKSHRDHLLGKGIASAGRQGRIRDPDGNPIRRSGEKAGYPVSRYGHEDDQSHDESYRLKKY